MWLVTRDFKLTKWRIALKISSVNVTKFQGTADLVTFNEEILNGKHHFLCSALKTLGTLTIPPIILGSPSRRST